MTEQLPAIVRAAQAQAAEAGFALSCEPGDMTPPTWINDEHQMHTAKVRATLLAHPSLVAAELAEASGMILATRRRA